MRYWKHQHQPFYKHRWFFAAVAFAVVAAGTWVVFAINRQDNETPLGTEPSRSAQPAEPEFSSVEANYIFSGTIVLGRAVEQAAEVPGGYDYSQPFSKLDTLGFDRYDAGVIDLECPSTGRRVSFRESVDNLIFDCHPDWFPALGKYFQIMNLAGNHTYDAGPEGFEKTVANIQEAGLQAVGHYSPRVKEDVCEVAGMPVRLKKAGGGEEKGTLPLAICSYHYQFEFDPQPGELEMIREYAEVMPVIGMMHAGAEYQSKASSKQREIARKMIDYGAEFVVGNGAHWVQDTEVYKDKLIVYSTGNFIFDQIDYETRLGFSLAASMELAYDDNVAEWLRLGESCKQRDDDCLEVAASGGLEKFTPTFTFDAVSSFGGYRRVTQKASPEQERDILQRANWQETTRQLGQ